MARHAHTASIYLAIMLAVCLTPALGAEEDTVLLTIEGNLIGLVEPFDGSIASREEALRLANTYHQLLPPSSLVQIETLHDQLLSLIPDFQVAYAAADSAEITDVMSEIDLHLTAMQKIYAREYRLEVIGLLTQAYQLILPKFGDE